MTDAKQQLVGYRLLDTEPSPMRIPYGREAVVQSYGPDGWRDTDEKIKVYSHHNQTEGAAVWRQDLGMWWPEYWCDQL